MPASIEKLQKFFKLETERGFDNRAVVGGLEKILPSWQAEARRENLDENIIQSIVKGLNQYAALSATDREALLNDLLQVIRSAPTPTLTATAPTVPQASQNRPSPSHNRPQEHKDGRQARSPRPEQQRDVRRPSNPVVETVGSPGLNAPLTVLHGVGQRNVQSLHSLHLFTLGDLMYYFPRRYDDYSQLKPLNRVEYNDELTVIATIQSVSSRPFKGGQGQITEAVVSDGTGYLRVNWFNQPWLSNKLKSGDQIVLSGKVDMYLGRLVMTNPETEEVEQEHLHTNRIVPVYPSNSRVNQKWLRRIMHQTITFWAPRMSEFLPPQVLRNTGLMDLPSALLNIHFPESMAKLQAAQKRLAFDEIFLIQMGVLRQKRAWQSVSADSFSCESTWLDEKISALPFTLTDAQRKAVGDIQNDFVSGRPMSRLLQGDVGSGKTIVAALACAIITQHGSQTAIMAPTSILAEQHYRNFTRLLVSHEEDGVWNMLQPEQVALLVGNTPEAEKRQIRDGLADGTIKVVIGTHALLEDPVTFNRLQFVVVDEQHRFGVAQRSILRAKGANPHLLVMTATPIPRSLALTLYGDLDLTVMDEMPAGRLPIQTHLRSGVEREIAYQKIREQVAKGYQAFIIYPLVEKGDREEVKAAVDEAQRLQTEIFPNLRIGLLHGRMKADEKDAVMTAFRDGEYHIMVSTSVIEVGVDVPNATVMIIEGANRFGLAQLHQFRGRVGRGQAESHCILIPDSDDALENERLSAMCETNNGFILADRDLQQRGPGDFLGTRQAGFMDLQMAKLTDVTLIEAARKEAAMIFDNDPELADSAHEHLEKMLERFWGTGRGERS